MNPTMNSSRQSRARFFRSTEITPQFTLHVTTDSEFFKIRDDRNLSKNRRGLMRFKNSFSLTMMKKLFPFFLPILKAYSINTQLAKF